MLLLDCHLKMIPLFSIISSFWVTTHLTSAQPQSLLSFEGVSHQIALLLDTHLLKQHPFFIAFCGSDLTCRSFSFTRATEWLKKFVKWVIASWAWFIDPRNQNSNTFTKNNIYCRSTGIIRWYEIIGNDSSNKTFIYEEMQV